jgi:hypothetical protein
MKKMIVNPTSKPPAGHTSRVHCTPFVPHRRDLRSGVEEAVGVILFGGSSTPGELDSSVILAYDID